MTHGIEMGLQLNANVEGGLTTLDIDRAKAAGARWFRFNIDMAFVWPTLTTYNNDTPDYNTGAAYTRMTYAKSIGLKVLGTLAFSPAWLITGGAYPSAPPNDYAKWSTMCARAYRDLHTYVDCFEVWNEPNISNFWLEAGTSTYRTLLRQVVNAMRGQAVTGGGTWADPVIISGGPASSGSGSTHWTDRWDRGSNPAVQPVGNLSIGTFLDQLFHATLGIVAGTTVNTPYVSGYGVHTYTWGPNGVLYDFFENPLKHCFLNTITVGSSPFAFWDDIICAHESYGTPSVPPTGYKKLWATESGWPGTDPSGLGYSYTTFGNEAAVAAYMDTQWGFWELFSYRGAGPAFHFQSRDDPNTAGDAVAKYGGLLRLDNSAKAIRGVYQTHANNYAAPSAPGGARAWDSGTTKWDDPTVTWDGGIVNSGPPPQVNTTLPDVRLEMGIYPRPDSGPWFVLGDPQRGKLGSTQYVLGPEFFYYNIGPYCESGSVSQGRLSDGGRTQPGNVQATLWNNDRRFDKKNAAGPYYPYLKPPNMRLRLLIDGLPWINTIVNRLSPAYMDVNVSKVDIGGDDGLQPLSRAKVEWHARTQSSKSRINQILDHAGYTGFRSIDDGIFTLGAYDVSGDALSELSLIAEAEDTLLYCAPDGSIVFLARSKLSAAPVVTFNDDGTAGTIPYKTIEYADGYDVLATQVTVTRRAKSPQDGPDPQVYANEPAVTQYGRIDFPIPDSPVGDDGQALVQAAIRGARLSVPVDRVSSISLDLADFPLATRLVLGLLDMGKVCRVVHHPPGGGSPATDQLAVVTGRTVSWQNGTPANLPVTYSLHVMDGGV